MMTVEMAVAVEEETTKAEDVVEKKEKVKNLNNKST